MPADRLAQAVREQLAIGRVLPLGGAADGTWITERAAAEVLRAAAGSVPGVRLGTVRIGLADDAPGGAVPDPAAPPSALRRGPLRIDAAFEAAGHQPLTATTQELRAALGDGAANGLGLVVSAIDLRITGLLDDAPPRDERGTAQEAAVVGAPSGPLALAAAAVPGVTGLTSRLGGAGSGVLVQIAVGAGHRALDVARAVRDAVAGATGEGAVAPAVLVTDIG